MIEGFVGHKPHVAPPMANESRATSVLPKSEWADEKRYFVWLKGWLRSEAEAQIVTETFLPKRDVLRKVLLFSGDRRSLGELMIALPCPAQVNENA